MESKLKNKRVLFFAPAFFGYENKIKSKMEELGIIVDMFDERSIHKSYQKALLKLNPNIFSRKTEKYYLEILELVKNIDYDYVLFIKCEMATETVLKRIKKLFPKADLNLYLYDALDNIKNIDKKLQYFDYIFSFDRYDCLNNQYINFRPLFYCDEYKTNEQINKEYKYDICFIGTIHSDRYKILKVLCEKAKKEGLNIFIYPFLQSKFIYYLYKMTKKEFRDTTINNFKFDKISSENISKIVDKSRIIIDIQHPNQTGLTMRTIEMIGMKKKIITTNKDIVNYDFYDSRNIFVLDRNDLNISLDAFSNKYFDMDDSVYNRYSLESWIYEVLGDEKE